MSSVPGLSVPTEKKFRLNAKNLFATFPQNEVPKETAMEKIKNFYGDKLEACIVAQESHKDGNKHLHVIIMLKSRANYKAADCLNWIAGKQGNYQAIRSLTACAKYVTKDGNYVSHNFDVDSLADGKKTAVFAKAAAKILDGSTVYDLISENPGFVLQHGRKVLEFQTLVAAKNDAEQELLEWTEATGAGSAAPIATWLNTNLFKKRKLKQKQLWIWGPKNVGKTTLSMLLAKFCRVYVPPAYEDFYCKYLDGHFDLVVFDEFAGNKPLQFMNSFCDGSWCTLKKKTLPAYTKKENVPVIVLSNFNIRTAYRKAAETGGEVSSRLETLEARFQQVYVDTFMDIKIGDLSTTNFDNDEEMPSVDEVVETQQPTVVSSEGEKNWGDLELSTNIPILDDDPAEPFSPMISPAKATLAKIFDFDSDAEDDDFRESQGSQFHWTPGQGFTALEDHLAGANVVGENDEGWFSPTTFKFRTLDGIEYCGLDAAKEMHARGMHSDDGWCCDIIADFDLIEEPTGEEE